jgi:hypothetical protein
VMKAGSLRQIPLSPPGEETVSLVGPGGSFKVLQYALLGALALLALGGGFLIWKQRPERGPELEDIVLGHGEVSRTHKQIYQDNTSLNLSTVSKLQKKQAETTSVPSSTPPASSAAKSAPVESHAAGEDRLSGSGVQILQVALKRFGIVSSALELLELAGEGAEKLTVYGIYLAARAKGVQVQGIKVDMSYLHESSAKTHLVFFTDESFALLEKITDDSISLSFGMRETKEMPLQEFKGKWNGYVITLTKPA